MSNWPSSAVRTLAQCHMCTERVSGSLTSMHVCTCTCVYVCVCCVCVLCLGQIECEPPNNRLNKFVGTLHWKRDEDEELKNYALDNDKLLLRVSVHVLMYRSFVASQHVYMFPVLKTGHMVSLLKMSISFLKL